MNFCARSLEGVKRMPFAQALRASTTHRYDYLHSYVTDLESVIDLAAIRDAKITLGVDPLGGAGIDYWPLIAERYGLNLTVVNKSVDPTFRFMTVDWDGKIRMDPSSPYAMQSLIGMKDKFDISFAADTDHDRHGIVTKSSGLLPPNHYLSVCIHYLFANRKNWGQDVAVGKTVVSSSMIDRVTLASGTPVIRGPGWLQMVCRRSARPDGWASAVKKAPEHRFSTGTPAYGPPTRTASFLACSRRKLPRVWEKIRAKSTVNSLRSWGTRFTSVSMLPPLRNKKQP